MTTVTLSNVFAVFCTIRDPEVRKDLLATSGIDLEDVRNPHRLTSYQKAALYGAVFGYNTDVTIEW